MAIHTRLKVLLGLLIVIFTSTLMSTGANAADSLGTVTTYSTGWDYRNAYTILQDHDGNIWFGRDIETTKSLVKYVPSTNTYTDWTPNSPVLSLANGPDSNVWFTSGAKFGKVDNAGVKTEYSMPTETRSSVTVNFYSQAIATGPDGRIWVSARSSQGDMKMFMYNTSGALYKSYVLTTVPTSASDYEPLHDLAVDSVHGRVWFLYRDHSISKSVAGYLDVAGESNNYALP